MSSSRAYALRSDHEASDDVALAAGNQWAKKAQQLLLANLNNISVDNTMVCGHFIHPEAGFVVL